MPVGYDGEFGPGIKALVISLYYGGNMTQGKQKRVFREYWYLNVGRLLIQSAN